MWGFFIWNLRVFIDNMKFIITPTQYKLINEVSRTSGHYGTEPLWNLFAEFNQKLKTKDKLKIFDKFFRNKIGFDTENKLKKKTILDFFNSPYYDFWPKELRDKDSLSGLAYYIAKNYFILEDGVELEYFITDDDDDNKEVYFFDPLLKIFVGKIQIEKRDELHSETWGVKVSAADEGLIGTGYGTKMYLTLINNVVDYLLSDYTLFTGAYRIWKHILPKYVNVWGAVEKVSGVEYQKINPIERKDVRKYDFFVASTSDFLQQA